MPVAATSVCHWLRLMATTITRRPSLRGEVAAERAVHVVAERRTVLVGDLGLCEEAEVGDHGERDVGERQLHELALAGGATVAFGGEDADHRVEAGRDVPGGSALFTGNNEPTGPVAVAIPDAALTV